MLWIVTSMAGLTAVYGGEGAGQIEAKIAQLAAAIPNASVQLLASDSQIGVLGRVPNMVTADAGYYSQALENAVLEKGVKRVAVPNRNTRSAERKMKEHSRWFRNAQRWRTGCEGRISVLKRRHGLNRCRYRGSDGMKRWVGLGIMADTLISMGNVLAARA